MVSLHSDHVIHPGEALVELIPKAAALLRENHLIGTIAIRPNRPETGYGYLRPGDSIRGGAVSADTHHRPLEGFRIGAFVEKPDLSRAEAYLSQGYLWNSGIFILPVSRFLEEVTEHAPEIGDHLYLLDRDEDAAFFEAVPTISVDEAVLERSGHVGAVEATFAWDDVGNWESLSRTLPGDEAGNFSVGEVHAVDSRDSIVWSEEGPVVLHGVEGLVVVRSGGLTYVASRAAAGEMKNLLAQLPARLANPTASE
jgi:mannose-1-phosphate guanylyltransferase